MGFNKGVTLETILEDSKLSKLFLDFVLKTQSQDNLEFYIEVEMYKRISDGLQLQKMGKRYVLVTPPSPSFCLSRHPHHHISYITSSHSWHITYALLHSPQHIHSHLFAFTCTYTSHLPTSFSHLLQVISYLSGSRLRA